jgi:amino acid transporter
MAEVDPAVTSRGLARNAIGLREVLFQSITHMAPAAAVAFSIIVGAGFAGAALPLAVILALIACLSVAYCIGELARHLPSAGGMYTYVARGIHPTAGFLVAWGYAFAEPLGAPLLYLIFGNVVAGTLNIELGWSADLWWMWALLAAVLVLALGYYGISISTHAGTALGLFEIVVFAALALWLIIQAAGDNTLSVFNPDEANVAGFEGMGGVFAATIFSVLAFIGFEAAAPLAEEARDPKRTIRLAVVYSCLGIGLFYVLTTYAATVYFGPDRMQDFATFGGGNPWDGLARDAWGVGWVLVFLAVANSAIANANAAANAATRTWYAMGRIRLLPQSLENIHPQWKSPIVAVWLQFIVGVVVSLGLGFKYGVLPAFILVATILTAVIVLIYIAVNISCFVFYRREHPEEFNFFKHLVVPLVGIAMFVPAWLTAVGIPAFKFIAKLEYPLSLAGPVVAVWYLIGLVYMFYLLARARDRIVNTGKVFIEEAAG